MKNTKDFYKNKKVLVAGGTGTIGVPLVKMLVEQQADVSVVSMDTEAYTSRVLPKEVKFIRADLTVPDNCAAVTKDIQYVFDMVGIKGSTQTNNLHFSRMLINFLLFQIHLLEESRKNKVEKFLLVGSICEYPQSLLAKEESTVWGFLPSQNDKYVGMVKRLGELQAQAYFEENSWDAVRIIRPSNVYGPYDDFNPASAQVVGSLISQAVDNKYVKVLGDGKHIRDFVFSEDVAYWSLVALEALNPCDAVNIGSGNGLSIKELTEIIQIHLPDTKFEFTNDGYQGDFIRVLSTKKAKDKIDYFERTSLVEGIGKTIKWYLDNKNTALIKGKFYE